MKVLQKIGLIASFALGLNACSEKNEEVNSSPESKPNNIASLIDQAESQRQQASALGFEWRDTGKFIQQAKDALDKGNKVTAERLAQQALDEGKNAVAQGQLMKSNWENYIPQ